MPGYLKYSREYNFFEDKPSNREEDEECREQAEIDDHESEMER